MVVDNETVIDFLSEVKFDIEQDNNVTFLGDWDKEDLDTVRSLDVIIKYLSR